MSIKEIAYDIIDNLTEEQLRGFVLMFRGEEPEEIPNEKTLAAIRETEDILSGKLNVKGYNNVKGLFEDLNA